MSNIIPLGSSEESRERKFRLEDLCNDGPIVSGTVITPIEKACGWSNQELATIHRALRLLQNAGVSVELDQGVTDDGSPWCVFVGKRENVLVHIARIDFEYVLDGVGLGSPIRGRTFDDIINRFVNESNQIPEAEQSSSATKILAFSRKRNSKLFVHPAAQFAALIWAAMIAQDAAVGHSEENDLESQQEPALIGPMVTSLSDISENRADGAEHIPNAALQSAVGSSVFERLRQEHVGGSSQAGILSLAYLLIEATSFPDWKMTSLFEMQFDLDEEYALRSMVAQKPQQEFLDSWANDQKITSSSAILDARLEESQEDAAQAIDAESDFLQVSLSDYYSTHQGVQKESVVPVASDDLEELPHLRLISFQSESEMSTKEEADTSLNEDAPLTINDLFENLDKLLWQNGEGFAVPDNSSSLTVEITNEDSPDVSISISPTVDDRDIIEAMFEFIDSMDGKLTYHTEYGTHVVTTEVAELIDSSDLRTLSWTFEDGSQIMIVGATEDFDIFDSLFV